MVVSDGCVLVTLELEGVAVFELALEADFVAVGEALGLGEEPPGLAVGELSPGGLVVEGLSPPPPPGGLVVVGLSPPFSPPGGLVVVGLSPPPPPSDVLTITGGPVTVTKVPV